MNMNFAQQDVQKAFARGLQHNRIMLRLTNNSLKMVIEGDRINALSEAERKQVRKAMKELDSARKRLKGVATSLAERGGK